MKAIISLVTLFFWLLVYPIVLLATSDADNNIQQASSNLLKACMTNGDNVEDVESALGEGADINIIDEKTGYTPLMAATIQGSVLIVRYLLKSGADVSIADKTGYTAPHLSAIYGTADVMQALIEAGVDVNEYHQDGFVPLHRTCWQWKKQYADTLRVLLRHGVPYNFQTKNGYECEHLVGDKLIMNVLKEETGIDFDTSLLDDDDDDDDDYYSEDDDAVPLEEFFGVPMEEDNNDEL